ncbi:unnamed protein product [Fusarium venenatum]|uniref:Uncharacterized protein n=1 Tax=Fusarium venenatum TaxID=56646 RepID=A0A2L2TQF3_9HYPO|nr:uncharacterized protein FVRRES_08228 [Fusarium venenatum]CEI68151.1 unnamed protein product [Fusarium venenatum]
MDPLSIIASSLTLATATHSALNFLVQLYGAPLELCALSNEVTDLTVVLEQVLLSSHSQRALAKNISLDHIAHSITTKLIEINESVEKWNDIRQKRNLRSLGVTRKINGFRTALQDLRMQLVTYISASSAVSLASVQLDIQGIHAVVSKLAIQRQGMHMNLATHSDGLLAISNRLQSVEDLLKQPDYRSHNLNKARSPEPTLLTCITDEKSEIQVDCSRSTDLLLSACNSSMVSAISITTTKTISGTSQVRCACSCHRIKLFRSPMLLDSIIGGLFVGYTGRPNIRQPCNVPRCKEHCSSLIQVTYTFPRWFVAKLISAALLLKPAADPSMTVAVHRLVAKDSNVFYYSKIGNIEKLKQLFSSGGASPNDVHCSSGVTALDFAISYRKIETIKFLLQAGANPLIRSKIWGACPSDKAWSKILSGRLSPADEKAFRELFDHTKDIEGRNFTKLHKTVLKLESTSISEELEMTSTEMINARDSLGQTALCLAAELGSTDDLRLLLSRGADPSIPSYCQKDPLIFAARSANPTCVKLLLEAGSSVTYRTGYNHTALHYAAIWSPADGVEHLVNAGMDMNFPDKDGRTPLGFTILSDNFDAAVRLLANGAQVRCPNAPAVDPLLCSIKENKHRFLDLFIRNGFDIHVPLPNGQTLLHIIAEFADADTMALCVPLASEIIVGQVDTEGRTAIDIINTRENREPGSKQNFYDMLGHCFLTDEDVESENWEDAVEIMIEA